MKSTFKITYQPADGTRSRTNRLIEAEDANEALRILGGVYRVYSVSVQCAGVRKDGNPCQRFTSDTYCCEDHDPRHYQFEVSLDLDDKCIVRNRFKGSTHYGEDCYSIDEAMENWNRGDGLSKHPRTQMVDRLIALEWDIDAVKASYEIEEWERRLAYRNKHFRVTVEAAEIVPRSDNDLEIRATHNGWQWSTLGLTLDEAKALKTALDDYIKTGRDQTRNIDGIEFERKMK